MKKTFIQFLIFILIGVLVSSCSSVGKSLRGLVSGKENENAKATGPRFSEQENLRTPASTDKQYHRMNRQRFEEEAEVKEDAGSLWVMEGQGAYLFSQNQMRMVGDLLNVKLEGAAKSQLQTKVKVIARLLERLEGARNPASANAATPGAQPGQPATPPAAGQQAQAKDKPEAGAEAANPAASPKEGQANAQTEGPFNVQTVPTRIVEQLKDGSYRVRGMQPFMIGKREYKVIVTGVVRPEDFDDQGIEAGKLLDPQFDIVSSRKGATL